MSHWRMGVLGVVLVFVQGAPKLQAQTAAEKVEALIRQLDTKDEEARLNAVMALGELGRAAKAAAPALVDALKTGNDDLRLNVAIALGRIGKDAVTPVVPLVGDKEPALRFYAVWALGLIGPEAQSATKELVGALKDKNHDVRRKAAYALRRVEATLQDAGAALVVALGDNDSDVREEAIEAIKRFGPPVIPLLADGIRTHASVRELGIGVLQQIPADPKIVVAAFLPLLRDKNAAVQQVSGDVLVRQGKPALAPLLALLADEDRRVRLESLRLLNTLPPDGPLMLPELKRLMGSETPAMRESALVVLSRLGADGVPLLKAALTDKDAGVRWTAAFALGEMGATARDATSALGLASEDADGDVRESARAALRKIRGER